MKPERKDSPEKLARLVRALNLVPYVHQHPNKTPMEIARDLGYSHVEVMEDLQRLHMSGVGKGPEELIDLVADWTGVTLIDDQGMTAPLRLTPTEANALLLTLESLETMPGLVDQSAVTSAAHKLREVMRNSSIPDAQHPGAPEPASTISAALTQRRMLELTYYSATSDSVSTRTVAPLWLFHRDGFTYLAALEDGENKTFRFDRIRHAALVDTPVPGQQSAARSFDAADPFGFANANVAHLRVRRDATWLADYWQIDLNATDETTSEAEDQEYVDAMMPYGNAEWLIRFCLSQADRVEVISPEEIANEVTRRGGEARARYNAEL